MLSLQKMMTSQNDDSTRSLPTDRKNIRPMEMVSEELDDAQETTDVTPEEDPVNTESSSGTIEFFLPVTYVIIRDVLVANLITRLY